MNNRTKMYENQFKNVKSTSLDDLHTVLQLIADLDKEIELYAIGGTAMVLKNIKEATRDIDFMTMASYDLIKEMFTKIGMREESSSRQPNIWYLDDLRIDIFFGDSIMGIPLCDDWKARSEHIKTFGKVELSILDWYDICMTKIARAEDRDYEDVKQLMGSQKLDIKELKKHFYDAVEDGALIESPDEKFKHLERLL